MIGGGTLAVMAIVGAIGLSEPRSYQASVLLKVGSMFVAGKGTGTDAVVLIEDPQTIARVLTSDGRLLKLKEFLGLAQTDVSGLSNALSIQVLKSEIDPTGSTMMDIRLTLDNPKLAVEGLHFIANALIEEHRNRYEAGVALIDRESQSMREKIATNQLQRENAQKRIAEVRRYMNAEVRYREELLADVARLTDELVRSQSLLAKSKPNPSDTTLLPGVLQNLDAHLSDLKVERNSSRLRTQEWEGQIRDLERERVGLGDRMADLQTGLAQLTADRARLDNTRLRSEPVLPTNPVGTGVKRKVAVAGLVGAMAVIVLAFFLEYIRNARRRLLDERALMELQQS